MAEEKSGRAQRGGVEAELESLEAWRRLIPNRASVEKSLARVVGTPAGLKSFCESIGTDHHAMSLTVMTGWGASSYVPHRNL